MNCEGVPAVFGPLPQNYDISKPRCVAGTSIHFHSVAIGATRRLSRRMPVQVLTHATEEGVVFLVTFPDACKGAWMLTLQSFLSFREYAIRRNFAAAFTSEQGHSVWFQADSFLGHSLLRCMSACALKALASLDLNYYIACLYSCSLTLAVKTRFL